MVNAALPPGYEEVMAYGMIGWILPLSAYPDTYNKQPLSFAGLAAQKNAYSLYLTCAYSDPARAEALKAAAAAKGRKLDMGKSCIRFKKPDQIPFKLIGELASKMSPKQWIAVYEKNFKK